MSWFVIDWVTHFFRMKIIYLCAIVIYDFNLSHVAIVEKQIFLILLKLLMVSQDKFLNKRWFLYLKVIWRAYWFFDFSISLVYSLETFSWFCFHVWLYCLRKWFLQVITELKVFLLTSVCVSVCFYYLPEKRFLGFFFLHLLYLLLVALNLLSHLFIHILRLNLFCEL